MRNRDVKSQLEKIKSGDLVCVEWCDASVGKSLRSSDGIDVPVKSWGIFVGILGSQNKHIVLAQNSFFFADGHYDVDYTAILLASVERLILCTKESVDLKIARDLFNSFVSTRSRMSRQRMAQRSLRMHGLNSSTSSFQRQREELW